ncbi:MAG: alpha-amylase family protein [Bacteroidales bacterium]
MKISNKFILTGVATGFLMVSCSPKPTLPVEKKVEKPVIYQVMTRLFGNDSLNNIYNGSITENGVGKFNDFTATALDSIHALGANYIWYTGVIAHASKTDYSAYGIPANHPGTVKGNAGSPYAIRDYYDVAPDLATNIDNRMNEFEELIKRTHESGMKVIIDFVPNHVAREYRSIKSPQKGNGLGDSDDVNTAFSTNNNFYYLPGESFSPQFDALGYSEKPAKATGNDVFSASPSIDDWYETIKLNYGVDYVNGRTTHFDTIPSTWSKMRDILLFWSAKGVDGFRTDMAEMVPVEFWEWTLPQIKKEYPDMIFIAEVYNPNAYKSYIEQGKFDYLYDKVGLYDTLKYVIQGKSPASSITVNAQNLKEFQTHMLNFLENHDEQRIANKEFAGSAEAGKPMMIVSATYTNSPVMLYFGQELGEEAVGAEGFNGDDGRTTIFDYYGLQKIKNWRNGGIYDGASLTDEEKELRSFYKTLLNLLHSEAAFNTGEMYDLTAANKNNTAFNTDRQFSYLRKEGNEVILAIVNFDNEEVTQDVIIPQDAFVKLGIPTDVSLKGKDLLTGSTEASIFTLSQPFHTTLKPYSGKLIKFTF